MGGISGQVRPRSVQVGETQDGKVTSFYVGLMQAIRLAEGCS